MGGRISETVRDKAKVELLITNKKLHMLFALWRDTKIIDPRRHWKIEESLRTPHSTIC